jgi:ubiquitin
MEQQHAQVRANRKETKHEDKGRKKIAANSSGAVG